MVNAGERTATAGSTIAEVCTRYQQRHPRRHHHYQHHRHHTHAEPPTLPQPRVPVHASYWDHNRRAALDLQQHTGTCTKSKSKRSHGGGCSKRVRERSKGIAGAEDASEFRLGLGMACTVAAQAPDKALVSSPSPFPGPRLCWPSLRCRGREGTACACARTNSVEGHETGT